MKNLFRAANIITLLRIVLSVPLLFVHPLSTEFCLFYASAGITDIVDGIVARKTHTESKLGEKLDSIADIVFVVVCMIRILPIMEPASWMLIWAAAVLVLRLAAITLGIIKEGRIVMLHTTADKITGIGLFLLPFALKFCDTAYFSVAVCIIATYAAIQEIIYVSGDKNEKRDY